MIGLASLTSPARGPALVGLCLLWASVVVACTAWQAVREAARAACRRSRGVPAGVPPGCYRDRNGWLAELIVARPAGGTARGVVCEVDVCGRRFGRDGWPNQ